MVAKFSAETNPAVEQSDLVIIFGVASLLLVISYFAGLFTPTGLQKPLPTKEIPKTKVHTNPMNETSTREDEDSVIDDDDFSFEPISEPTFNSLVEVVEPTEETTEHVEEIIDIDEEMDTSASGRLASLRSEIESGDKKNETREERMKRLFGEK